MRTAFDRPAKLFGIELIAGLGLALATSCGPEETGTDSGSATTTESSSGTTAAPIPASCDPPPSAPDPSLQEYKCFPLPMDLATCPVNNATIVHESLNPLGGCHWTEFEILCGPDATPDQEGACCYFTVHGGQEACPGRPFTAGGEARTAATLRRDDWSDAALPTLHGLSQETCETLAARWTAAAAAEHASIASFARFVLQLLAVGAPASLVEAAQQAIADEVAHARACYAIAGAYGGCPIGPAPLDMTDVLGPMNIADIAVAAVHEGCIGETLAALSAEIGGAHADDPAIRATLERIAADERRHALLAWRFVQWAARRCPDTATRIAAAFSTALQPRMPAPGGPDPLLTHGLLSPDAQHDLARAAMLHTIAPTANAVLQSSMQ